MTSSVCYSFFFFFQAEDGIRDLYVTGVQTCALPILCGRSGRGLHPADGGARRAHRAGQSRQSRRVHHPPAGRDGDRADRLQIEADRKSTRLNSSHVEISYAVFCLKKKKKKKIERKK